MGDVSIAQDFLDGVEDLVATLGQTVTLVREVTGDYVDQTKPTKGRVITKETASVEAVLVDYKEEDIDGTVILRGDRLVVVDLKNTTIQPDLFSGVIIDGVEWQTVNIERPYVAGIPVTAFLQVRR